MKDESSFTPKINQAFGERPCNNTLRCIGSSVHLWFTFISISKREIEQ